MRPRNAISACLVVIGLGALVYFVARPSSSSDHAGASPSAPAAALDDSEERLFAGGTDDPERTVVDAPTTTPDPLETAGAVPVAETTPSGIVVRGVVRFADDAAPAAGLSFILSHAGGPLRIQTDEAGRFGTAPVVQPGIVTLWHRKTDERGFYPRRLRFEPESLTISASPGHEVEIELTLLRPERELVVSVEHLDGRPAPGASVRFEARQEPRPEKFTHHAESSVTGDDGRTGFALYDLESLRAAGVYAVLEEPTESGGTRSLASAHLELEVPVRPQPTPTQLRLVLDEAATLLIRVIDSSGAAVPGQGIWVHRKGPFLASWIKGDPRTDEFGEARVEGLALGEYRLGMIGGPGVEARDVTLHAGMISEVEFVVAGSGRPLAVAGRVVDEEGAPLAGVHISVTYGPREGPGDTSASRQTDSDGRFEFYAEPSDGLTVTSDRDIFGDEFTPNSLELPFGSIDVLFTRLRPVSRRRVAFEIVDAVTRERLEGALVMTYRAPNLRDYAFHRADGLAFPLCPEHPGTTLVIDCPGYRRATILLTDLMRQEPIDGLRRVALERGLHRWLHVEGDDADGESGPLMGARVLHNGRVLGHTDAAGGIEVDLHTWPENGLTIEADGFGAATWLPTDAQAELEAAWVWLERG